MSDSEICTLFSQTLDGEYDDEEPWEAIHNLRKLRSQEVFDLAAEWCKSPEELRRTRGVDVLAQIGSGSSPEVISAFQNSALPIILELLEKEKAARPIASAIYALGHIGLAAAIPAVTSHVRHFNPDVRHAVAFALGSFADDQSSVESLMILMEDQDEAVRDWATFSLGAIGDADGPEIRKALTKALSDESEDVCFEAAIGLGRRRDRKAAGPLLELLIDDPENQNVIEVAKVLLAIDDTAEVASNELLSALRRMEQWGK